MYLTRRSSLLSSIPARVLTIWACALLMAACGGGDGGGDPDAAPMIDAPVPVAPEQEALDSAEALWANVDSAHYRFVSQQSCECLPEQTAPIVVEVMNGAIVSAVYESDMSPVPGKVEGTLRTIDGLFTTIQQAIDEGAYSVDVSYDSGTGMPVSINIDYDENIADEEFYLDVRDFEIIPSVGV